jgi:hypothetical protein
MLRRAGACQARQVFVAHSRAEADQALATQAAFTRRTVEVSRSPHVLVQLAGDAEQLRRFAQEVAANAIPAG